jgi:hypothetical protein
MWASRGGGDEDEGKIESSEEDGIGTGKSGGWGAYATERTE